MNDKPVKILRVGGTSYSGSTMLDLMLANADDGFSCGEINALFRPYRKHHFDPQCGCGDPDCGIWKELKKGGERRVWRNLVQMVPHVKVIVDSSKELVWLRDQSRRDLGPGFKVINVLIWKTPAEYAYSRFKRDLLKGWKKDYLNYHKRFFQIAGQWHSVAYSELATDPAGKLCRLCQRLGIEYFPGKETYWNRTHHTLFGSDSAKLHLYGIDTSQYKKITNTRGIKKPNVDVHEELEVQKHRSFYYDSKITQKLPLEILSQIENNEELDIVRQILEMTEVDFSLDSDSFAELISQLKIRPRWFFWQRMKRLAGYLHSKII